MTEILAKDIADQLNYMAGMYAKDLRALGHDKLDVSPGGKARTGYDYSYEVGLVNLRMEMRMRGEDPGPWPFVDGYAIAPSEFRDVETMAKYVEDTTAKVAAALSQVSEDYWTKQFPAGPDITISGLQYAIHAVDHMSYHMGQLNLVQSLHGDEEVHW